MEQLYQFIDNPGLQYVAEHIFLDLPPQSLAICRLVSKPWRNFIDSRRSLILLQIQQLLTNWISIVKENEIIKPELKILITKDAEDFKDGAKSIKDLDEIFIVLDFFRKCWTQWTLPFGKSNESPLTDLPYEHLNILNFAATQNQSNVVTILLNQCHNLRIESYYKKTPLHYACQYGSKETIQVLLQHPVSKELMSLDSICDIDQTPMHELCHNNEQSLKAMEFVLDFSIQNKIDINLKAEDCNKWTPIHYICQCGSTKLLKLVLDHPATKNMIDINATNSEGKTLFHVACWYKQIEVAKFILDYSFEKNLDLDLNAVTEDDYSALRYACIADFPKSTESKELLELILYHPIAKNINIRIHPYERTPLHTACSYGNINAVQALLEYSLKTDQDPGLNITDMFGMTPLHIAVQSIKSRVRQIPPLILLDHPISKKYFNMAIHLDLACSKEKYAANGYTKYDGIIEYLIDHCIKTDTLHYEYEYDEDRLTPYEIIEFYGKTNLLSKKPKIEFDK